MSQKKEFRMGKAAVMHMIQSQSGTLEKALMEYVMNSADAKATRVTIDFIEGAGGFTKIVITDNGCGFKSEDEIDSRFGEFGFDHTTEEEKSMARKYGRFGIGRGQMWNYASTIWETNKFRLDVDIRERGLEYKVTTHCESLHDGCRITATLYEDEVLSRVQHQAVTRSLASLVEFCDMSIVIDGKEVAGKLKDMKWDKTIKEAFIKVNPNSNHGVKVFNQGVYVQTLPHYRTGFSGILVSRENMVLNMARNDVMQSKCPVWKAASKIMRELAGIRSQKKGNALKDEDRTYLLSRLMGGEEDFGEVWSKKMVRDIHGRPQTLDYLTRHNEGNYITVAPQRKSQIGEHIHRQKAAFVCDPTVLEVFQADDGEDLVNKLNKLFEDFAKYQDEKYGRNWKTTPKRFTHLDYEAMRKQYGGASCIVPKPDKRAEAMLTALATVSSDIRCCVQWATSVQCEMKRKIVLGESDECFAWTDGNLYIAFEKRFLKKGFDGKPDHLIRLFSVMLHEYLHPENSSDEHCHGFDFYEAFEAAVTSEYWHPFAWVGKVHEAYKKACAAAGIQLNLSMLSAMDDMDMESIAAKDEAEAVAEPAPEPAVQVAPEPEPAPEPEQAREEAVAAKPAEPVPAEPEKPKAKPAVRVKGSCPKPGSLAEACLSAIEAEGGTASLSAIYVRIKDMGRDTTPSWKASVRKTVQNKNWFASKGDGVYAPADA